MLKEKYNSINGLRALSIFFVLFHHLELGDGIFEKIHIFKVPQFIINFLTNGQFGVNVFFVISGFLITSLMLQEEASTQKVSLKNFYIRRTLRIFPAYYFLLFVYFSLQLFGYIHIGNNSWLTALTYTKYLNWQAEWYTAHAWSLSIEEQFYLFWPAIFVFFKKGRNLAAVLLLLVSPFSRVFFNYYPVSWINELTIFMRIDAIAIGCLFALNKDWLLKKLSKNWYLVFWASLAGLFFWKNIYLAAIHFNAGLEIIFLPLGLGNGTISNICIALIIMYSVFGPRKIWFRFLNLKLLNYIGILSYSIYLWQQLFLNKTPMWYNAFPLNLVLILLAALFSYYCIERPFLRLKSKFSKLSNKAG